MRTSTAKANGFRCPNCGDETTRDETGMGYVRHTRNPSCDFQKGERDEFVPPDTGETWHVTENRDNGSLRTGEVRLEIGDVIEIRGESKQRRVTYVMGSPSNWHATFKPPRHGARGANRVARCYADWTAGGGLPGSSSTGSTFRTYASSKQARGTIIHGQAGIGDRRRARHNHRRDIRNYCATVGFEVEACSSESLMADWIYCGSNSAVDAPGTQSLLRTHQAIWCSPPGLRPWPGTPQAGHRLWLVWRESTTAQTVLLLGGGKVQQAPRILFGTNLLWTDPDAPGLRAAAEHLGYGGGLAMSFLRLTDIVFPNSQPPIQGLAGIDNRLNVATVAQVAVLAAALPIM